MKFLKTKSILIFKILLIIVLAGKICNWFLNYSEELNQILNTAMFCLIGISYLAFFWAFEKIIIKAIFLICGIYLILMNFMPAFGWSSILGIICIITPMILSRFYQEDELESHIE